MEAPRQARKRRQGPDGDRVGRRCQWSRFIIKPPVSLTPLIRQHGLLLAGLLLGLVFASLQTQAVLDAQPSERLIGEDLLIEGRILGLPEQRPTSTRFLFAPTAAQLAGQSAGQAVPLSGRIRLSWYWDAPALQPGERWRLLVRIKPPRGFVNPGGFDYEAWLFGQQISATGYVRNSDQHVRLAPATGWLAPDRWRAAIRARLTGMLQEQDIGFGLLLALLIGDRSALQPEHWEVFSRTGTGHLIAISGLHVGLIAGLAFVLLRWLWSQSTRLVGWMAAPRAAALGALLAAAGYAGLAGFAVSTQRALVMLAVVLFALALGRRLRPWWAFSLALVGVLVVDPFSPLSRGFWLSFGAVAALLLVLGGRLGRFSGARRLVRAQWAVGLGLLPLVGWFFSRASLIAPLINLLLIPLFGLILPLVLGAAAMALLTGWAGPLTPMVALLELGYRGLAWLSSLESSAISIGGRAGWVWLSGIFGIWLLLLPRGLPTRWPGMLLLLPLLLARPSPPDHGEARVALLDVGQGLSVVIQTQRHQLVYDTGPSFASGFNTGAAVVAPYLRDRDIHRLDLLILSHADRDHAGGANGLLGRVPSDQLLAGEPERLERVFGLSGASQCHAGQGWTWDGVTFEILHPEVLQPLPAEGNAASCVLRVSTGAASLLLTGDIGEAEEQRLIARQDRLRAEVLVAGHHGSAGSTSMRFLQVVDPSLVLYSSGHNNRFGFPHPDVIARVAVMGARQLNTASGGAIEFRLPAQGELPEPRLHRSTTAWPWRTR